jgi:hypothetical protein
MDLGMLRGHFRTLSGRYDLIDDDVSGTANLLINEACRTLDRLTEHQKTWGSHFGFLAPDSFLFQIPYCRAVKEVWVNLTGERWQLEKKDLQDLIHDYLSSPPTSGSSLYYSPVITRKIPEDADLSSFASYMDFIETSVNSDYNHNAIVILPPTDQQLLVEVRGFYYSKELVNDDDENFWSTVHPMTLLKAALRELDIFGINSSKVKVWDSALAAELDAISKDLIHEVVAETDEMEG